MSLIQRLLPAGASPAPWQPVNVTYERVVTLSPGCPTDCAMPFRCVLCCAAGEAAAQDLASWLSAAGVTLVAADELLHETMQKDRQQMGLPPGQQRQLMDIAMQVRQRWRGGGTCGGGGRQGDRGTGTESGALPGGACSSKWVGGGAGAGRGQCRVVAP